MPLFHAVTGIQNNLENGQNNPLSDPQWLFEQDIQQPKGQTYPLC